MPRMKNKVKRNWSMEQQLKFYADNFGEAEERYDILWQAWKHNKHWLRQLQEWIAPAYPTYSRHDESHALSVLHNIEMLLGEKQLRKISASDCFLILHVVYVHDIGMCITYNARKKLLESDEFMSFLKNIIQNGDENMKKYAELLLAYCEDMPLITSDKELMNIKLNIYYAVLYLVSEYKRAEHGEQSRKYLNEWISKPKKLGIGFSTSGIPSRFFYTIGSCASVHTSYDFDDVMALSTIDGGFSHDYMHPRFAAILLQLGDALDLDNDRFHPLVKEFMGDLPHLSKIHFEKHKAIRHLQISPEEIKIKADCSSPEVLRQVNIECECIRNILRDATFHWASICPTELNYCLPVFESVKLLLNGEPVQDELVNIKFEIQQRKAFNLLQGSNIYKKEQFVFLREIFQNALDASKLQYWADWKGSRWCGDDREEERQRSIDDIGGKLSPLAYPIEIEIHLAKKRKYEKDCILCDRKKNEKNKGQNVEYGVLVRVIDHGIGMTAEDISAISNIGSSHEKRKKEIEQMPSWLSPTAEFGIGLQAAFLAADSLTAYTHPRTNEKYKIEFEATGDKGKGFINVTPLKPGDNPKIYGTIFEIFVPGAKKRTHTEYLQAWSGEDPLSKDYEKGTSLLRHARELMLQLSYYLDSLLGEKLFPVKLRIYDFDVSEKNEIPMKRIKHELQNISLEIYIDGGVWEPKCQTRDKEEKRNENISEKKFVTWAYDFWEEKEREDRVSGIIEEYQFVLDCKRMKLYLWNRKDNVYARFGADRLVKKWKKIRNPDLVKGGCDTKIYYKGVYAVDINLKDDVDLLEYIDIKSRLERKYLTLNRCDFTEEGYEYIREKIYPDMLEAARKALNECVRQAKDITSRIEVRLKAFMVEDKTEDMILEPIFSAIGLATFAQKCNRNVFLAPLPESRENVWKMVLKKISLLIRERSDPRYKYADSTFFNIQVYKMHKGFSDDLSLQRDDGSLQNIAEIMDCGNKYAIVSERKTRNSSWEEQLVWLNPEDKSEERNHDKDIFPKNLIKRLKTEWKEDRRRDLIKKIDKWGDKFIDAYTSSINEELDYSDQSKLINQNLIFNWMLENFPTIAIFSNEEETIRINILDLEHTDSMYFNRNIKMGIYERMYSIYKEQNIQRFSMIAQTGFCQLSTIQNPKSTYFVKRGKFSRTGQRHMIMPLTGRHLEKMFDKREDLDIKNEDGKLYKKFRFLLRYSEYVCEKIKEDLCCGETRQTDDISKTFANEFDKLIKEEGDNVYNEIVNRLKTLIANIHISSGDSSRKEDPDSEVDRLNEIAMHFKTKNTGSGEGVTDWGLMYRAENKELMHEVFEIIFACSMKEEYDGKDLIEFLNENNLITSSPNDPRSIVEEIIRDSKGDKKGSISLEDELYQIAGFDDKGYSENKEDRLLAQRLVEYVKEEGWVTLTFEQYFALYRLYIYDMANDIVDIYAKQIEKIRSDHPILRICIKESAEEDKGDQEGIK